MGESTAQFRGRARFEADRYGSDRWVFVRELLQNARDAGATRVSFSIDRDSGRQRIACRDDGCGMTFDHARRYLFTLYASSKRNQKGAAGRFGIGFWSVLRFEPETISVRSRPSKGDGWEVILDGSLDTATVAPCVMLPGTEIVLERAAVDGAGEAEVVRVVTGDARFLRLRDDPQRQLEVTVNGRPVTAEFGLPPPSLEFRRPGLRGAVALSVEPGVEVFAHGLRVRSAAFLDELLTGVDRERRPAAELPDGLVPRVLVDSDRLRVLMARGEAREDRALRRLVGRARRELARLVRTELDQRAPRDRLTRTVETIAAAVRAPSVRWFGGAMALGSLLGLLLVMPGLPNVGRSVPGVRHGGELQDGVGSRSEAASVEPTLPKPYSDLALAYAGPQVDALDHQVATDLAYRPETADPLFAARRLTGFEMGGRASAGLTDRDLVASRGTPCAGGCLDVEIRIAASRGVLRLPVVTGHAIDPDSVLLDGEPIEMGETPAGEPAIWLKGERRGTLRYRSALSHDAEVLSVGRWPKLPDAVERRADQLLALPVAQRVEQARASVRSWVAYDRSPATSALHDEAERTGLPVFERAIAIGAGDCDVQNALLAAMLDRAGVPSRLAIGFVGSGGRARAGLHAWVEYLEDDVWRVADASTEPGLIGPQVHSAAMASATVGVSSSVSQATADAVQRAPRSGRGVGWLEAVTVALGVGLFVAITVGVRTVWKGRWVRQVTDSNGSVDMARLLRGALLRPEAYANVGTLYSRPLVPTVGRRALSLQRVGRLARSGRLYRSDRQSGAARDAARRGVAVIDSSRDEGRVVADLLGARDLDSWDGLLARARSTSLTRLVEAAAARRGERWLLRVAPDAPTALAVHEGEPLGLTPSTRVVVVAEESRMWRMSQALERRGGWAALMLASVVAEELEVAPATRTLVLADLARRAVWERLS